MVKNLPHLWHLSQKKTKHQIFFSLLTQRFAAAFEDLNSSLAQFTGKLWSCKMAQK